MPNTQKTLLAVLAHPDDETFGMGGTLALYARQGVQVHLVCATRGEVGEVDDKYMRDYASIADLREAELRCAAGHLGLTGVHFLNYRDSGMAGSPENQHPQALAAQPIEAVAAAVTHYIRTLKPQVILTFDPIGGYRHPDHIAIHQATVLAFHAAGDPSQFPDGLPAWQPQKLYYHTFPRGFLKLFVRLAPLVGKDPHKFGKNGDIDMASIAEVDFPVHARINYYSVADLRDEATACHASQGGTKSGGGLFGRIRRMWDSRDVFMRAFPEPDGHIEKDLFEGIS